nr:competence protein CoiA family protein [Sulfitobacter sp. R18_1]
MEVDDKSSRAVFVPPGAGPRVLFGENDVGDLVHVLDAERGLACNLICPDCKGVLVANKGAIKAAYFSHQSRIDCEHAGETALHLMAKEIIEQQGWFDLPEARAWSYRRGSGYSYMPIRNTQRVHFTRVEVEPRQEGFQPDLIGIKEIVKNGRKVIGRLHIEIYVTHKVDEEKLSRFRSKEESVLEVDLSDVERSLSKLELTDLLLSNAKKKWLYHRDIEKYEAQLRARLEAEEARDREKRRDLERRISEDLKKREESLNSAPAEATAEQRQFADREEKRWHLIGCGHFLDSEADDRYFDVPPGVWRAFALAALAPWQSNAKQWIEDEREVDLPATISSALKEFGWVKSPFSSKYRKKYCDHGHELVYWDRAADEVRKFLSPVLNGYDYPSVWSETKKLKMLSSALRTKYDLLMKEHGITNSSSAL